MRPICGLCNKVAPHAQDTSYTGILLLGGRRLDSRKAKNIGTGSPKGHLFLILTSSSPGVNRLDPARGIVPSGF